MLSAKDVGRCNDRPSKGGLGVEAVRKWARRLDINTAGQSKSDLCSAIAAHYKANEKATPTTKRSETKPVKKPEKKKESVSVAADAIDLPDLNESDCNKKLKHEILALAAEYGLTVSSRDRKADLCRQLVEHIREEQQRMDTVKKIDTDVNDAEEEEEDDDDNDEDVYSPLGVDTAADDLRRRCTLKRGMVNAVTVADLRELAGKLDVDVSGKKKARLCEDVASALADRALLGPLAQKKKKKPVRKEPEAGESGEAAVGVDTMVPAGEQQALAIAGPIQTHDHRIQLVKAFQKQDLTVREQGQCIPPAMPVPTGYVERGGSGRNLVHHVRAYCQEAYGPNAVESITRVPGQELPAVCCVPLATGMTLTQWLQGRDERARLLTELTLHESDQLMKLLQETHNGLSALVYEQGCSVFGRVSGDDVQRLFDIAAQMEGVIVSSVTHAGECAEQAEDENCPPLEETLAKFRQMRALVSRFQTAINYYRGGRAYRLTKKSCALMTNVLNTTASALNFIWRHRFTVMLMGFFAMNILPTGLATFAAHMATSGDVVTSAAVAFAALLNVLCTYIVAKSGPIIVELLLKISAILLALPNVIGNVYQWMMQLLNRAGSDVPSEEEVRTTMRSIANMTPKRLRAAGLREMKAAASGKRPLWKYLLWSFIFLAVSVLSRVICMTGSTFLATTKMGSNLLGVVERGWSSLLNFADKGADWIFAGARGTGATVELANEILEGNEDAREATRKVVTNAAIVLGKKLNDYGRGTVEWTLDLEMQVFEYFGLTREVLVPASALPEGGGGGILSGWFTWTSEEAAAAATTDPVHGPANRTVLLPSHLARGTATAIAFLLTYPGEFIMESIVQPLWPQGPSARAKALSDLRTFVDNTIGRQALVRQKVQGGEEIELEEKRLVQRLNATLWDQGYGERLNTAVRNNDVETVRSLLDDVGNDPNWPLHQGGHTVLAVAVSHDANGILHLLLRGRRTPVAVPHAGSETDRIRVEVDVNQRFACDEYVAFCGDIDDDETAERTLKNVQSATPLIVAARRLNVGAVAYIVAYAVRFAHHTIQSVVEAEDSDYGWTPLQWALYSAANASDAEYGVQRRLCRIVQILLVSGAQMNPAQKDVYNRMISPTSPTLGSDNVLQWVQQERRAITAGGEETGDDAARITVVEISDDDDEDNEDDDGGEGDGDGAQQGARVTTTTTNLVSGASRHGRGGGEGRSRACDIPMEKLLRMRYLRNKASATRTDDENNEYDELERSIGFEPYEYGVLAYMKQLHRRAERLHEYGEIEAQSFEVDPEEAEENLKYWLSRYKRDNPDLVRLFKYDTEERADCTTFSDDRTRCEEEGCTYSPARWLRLLTRDVCYDADVEEPGIIGRGLSTGEGTYPLAVHKRSYR